MRLTTASSHFQNGKKLIILDSNEKQTVKEGLRPTCVIGYSPNSIEKC